MENKKNVDVKVFYKNSKGVESFFYVPVDIDGIVVVGSPVFGVNDHGDVALTNPSFVKMTEVVKICGDFVFDEESDTRLFVNHLLQRAKDDGVRYVLMVVIETDQEDGRVDAMVRGCK